MKKKKPRFSAILLAAALLALLSPILPAQQKGKEFYPLRPGSRWIYQTGDKKEVILQVTRMENVGRTACAVLETKREDGLLLSECVAPQLDGVYRMRVGIDKFSLPVEPPLCFLKLPGKPMEWKIDSKLGGAGGEALVGNATQDVVDEVVVPFGKFKAVRVKLELRRKDETVTFTSYFVAGVGMVKHVEAWKGKELVLELQKYEEGK